MSKRSTKIIKFIQKHCKVPEGALVGQPIKLAPFQKNFIKDVYDNPHTTTDAFLSIARKNAKSATIACLVLVHLVGPEAKQNSQIISGAQSREQAGIIFKLASKMVNLNPKLQEKIRIIPSQKMLIGLPCNVEFQSISAESKTAHGLSPILAILDEVGQVVGPQDDFIDAITTAQGAHETPLLIAISTQAPTDGDLLSIWIDDALKNNDKQIICHLHSADDDAEVMDRKQWKKANPALGRFRSLKDLKKQANKAKRMPAAENTFRNLCLNQRVSGDALFISQSVWKSCEGPTCELNDTDPIWCGLDLSKKTDLTAFVICQKQDFVWHVFPFFWTPKDGVRERSKRDRVPYDMWVKDGFIRTAPGKTVDYEFVAKEIIELTEGKNVVGIAFDRWRIEDFKKELTKVNIELPLMLHGQGYKDMTPSIEAVESELLNARIRHGKHPVLTMCASNAVVITDNAEGRKLDKSESTRRIDGIMALTMAIGMCSRAEEDGPSIYETQGVRTFGTA